MQTSMATHDFQRLFIARKIKEYLLKLLFLPTDHFYNLHPEDDLQRITFITKLDSVIGPSQRKLLFEVTYPALVITGYNFLKIYLLGI
jgi:hypothetical protein